LKQLRFDHTKEIVRSDGTQERSLSLSLFLSAEQLPHLPPTFLVCGQHHSGESSVEANFRSALKVERDAHYTYLRPSVEHLSIRKSPGPTILSARSRTEFAIELKIGYYRRLWKGDTGMAKKHLSPKHMTKQSTLQFLTESLPGFTVGQQTSFKLQATGGTEL
jgi:hypothetical protein